MTREAASVQTFRAKARGEVPSDAARAKTIATSIPRGSLGSAPEEALWTAHRAALEASRGDTSPEEVAPGSPTSAASPSASPPASPPVSPPASPTSSSPDGSSARASLLELKHELARRLLGPRCRLCFLRCPVDRRAGERGACGLADELRPYQDFVHLGEELELIPTHAIYLAGCNYRCVYCSDWPQVDRPQDTAPQTSERLARSIEARRRAGALSLSFVGGVPDVSLPGILAALLEAEVSVPLVWNTNLSASDEAAELLEGLVDAYVADLKYGNEACAQAGSQVKGSLARTQTLLRRAAGEAYLIVRHLVLPDHVRCCTLPALDWLAGALPRARLNLMPQYLPPPQVAGTPWDRLPRADEQLVAREYALGLGFDLDGPGAIEPRAAPSPQDAPPDAPFSSEIRIEPGGRVVIENLSPELLGILEALGDEVPELELRKAAGEPFRERSE